MTSDEELARSLFKSAADVARELVGTGVVTTTIEATAVSDSADGYVLVDFGGDTVTGDGPEEQSADTDEDYASSETPVASDENMSPCVSVASTDTSYWSTLTDGLTIEVLDDGWARLSYDNSEGATDATLTLAQEALGSIEVGETYTLLVEVRPVLEEAEGDEAEDTPESFDPDDVPDDEEDGTGAPGDDEEEGDDTEGDDSQTVVSSITPTTATSQLGASTAYRMDAGETRLTLTGQSGDTLLGTEVTVDAGESMVADVRMSLYFGEYEGEYVPYGLLEGGAWQLVPTSSSVREGDKVMVSISGGSMVDSRAVGSGDRVNERVASVEGLAEEAQEAADSAGQAAVEATALADAASDAAAQAQATADDTREHFWADAGGAHVGPVANSAHSAGAGYNMTLGATDTTTGIILDHDDSTLASFTPTALDFYSDGEVVAAYTKDGTSLFARDSNDVSRQVAAFTKSGVSFFDGTGNGAENVVAAFGADGAVIGASGGEQVSIAQGQLSLINEGDVVAYVSGRAMGISVANVTESLNLDGFALIPRSNRNLSLKWMG